MFWRLCQLACGQSVGELMRQFVEYSRREKYSSNKRSIAIGGRQTSVNLEEPFWQGLREIAATRGIRLTDLITAIDKNRRFANLSSAIRLFVLEHYCTLARQTQNHQAAVTANKPEHVALSIPSTQQNGREFWASD
jgi:predicted DNA-binding ribbon-helix-helix protein